MQHDPFSLGAEQEWIQCLLVVGGGAGCAGGFVPLDSELRAIGMGTVGLNHEELLNPLQLNIGDRKESIVNLGAVLPFVHVVWIKTAANNENMSGTKLLRLVPPKS